MNYNIRHIIRLMMIGIAYAVVSCASDISDEISVPLSQEEMTVEVANGTRTIATTNENIGDQPFMLFGDTYCSAEYPDSMRSFFHWEKVVCTDKEKRIWKYTKSPQYWFMGQEHAFVAIHPYLDPERPDSQVTILKYKKNELSFTYNLPKKLQEAKDLLFATHRRKYSLDNTGPIRFEFTHLLSRINVSMALIEKDLMYDNVDEKVDEKTGNVIGNANEYIQVHSIVFQGIKTRASFTFTAKPLGSGTSTYDYDKTYLPRDDERVDTIRVELVDPLKVPNSYKKDVEEPKLEYVTALEGEEIVVMLPQSFDDDSESMIIVNYSINEDKDLMRRIVIPLKGTTWKEGTSYTYKFLIDNVYYGHIKDGKITVDIDDSRIYGEDGKDEERDDSWVTDKEDPDHNISFTYTIEGTEHN